MLSVQEQAKEIAAKHGKAMVVELVDTLLFQAIDDLVKSTASPIDDVIAAALKQPLKDQILKMIHG